MPGNAIAVVVLAAGGGTRLGGGKLLLPWRGQPLIRHTLALAATVPDVSEIVVVIGHEAEAMRKAIASCPFPVRVTENPGWEQGQSSSLRAGLAGLTLPALVLLGDQPLVRPPTLAALVHAHRDHAPAATAPTYTGRRGNPVILSPSLYPEIESLHGDTGARRILAGLGDRLLLVPVDDPGIHQDIDTPEAYHTLPNVGAAVDVDGSAGDVVAKRRCQE